MPRINLLPWRDQQRRERKLSLYVWLLFALVFLLPARALWRRFAPPVAEAEPAT